jgi:hypothetical protein
MTTTATDDSSGEDSVPPEAKPSSPEDVYDHVNLGDEGIDGVRPVRKVEGETGGLPPIDVGDKGINTLAAIAARTYFFDYFVHVAEKRYAGDQLAPKVRKLISDSRRLYHVVIFADILAKGVFLTLFTGLIGSLLLKALWPIIPGLTFTE